MTLEIVKPVGKPSRWWFNIIDSKRNLSITHKDMIRDYETKDEAKSAALKFAKQFYKERGGEGATYVSRVATKAKHRR